MPRHDDDEMEELGFDELPTFEADDIVVLDGPDGAPRELVLLAVVGYQSREYAVLAVRADLEADVDGDLIVARYDADAEGAARFSNVDDAAELEGVRGVLGDLIDVG